MRIPGRLARYRNPTTTYWQREIEKNTTATIDQRAYITRGPWLRKITGNCHSQAEKIEKDFKHQKYIPTTEDINKTDIQYKRTDGKKKCFFCGGQFPHQGGRSRCPAWAKECKTCRKLNHFAKCCRDPKQGQNIRTVDQRDSDSTTESSDIEPIKNVKVGRIGAVLKEEHRPVRKVKIGNSDMDVLNRHRSYS